MKFGINIFDESIIKGTGAGPAISLSHYRTDIKLSAH